MIWDEKEIATLFDEMAGEYDMITDLWYSWLFSNLHLFISKDLLSTQPRPDGKCLDIGCGTGYQSILFSLAGIGTEGIDISPALINVASNKQTDAFTVNSPFYPNYPFVKQLHAQTIANINKFRKSFPVQHPSYRIASASDLPYPDSTFQYINCIGSVLSFLDDYNKGLAEISRALIPGGYFFIEFENKYNPDLLWALFDSCIKGKIGYDQSFRESWQNLFSKPSRHLQIEFPFSKHEETVYMPIWIFRTGTLIKEMKQFNLEILRIRSVHNITNLIPSVWLDNSTPTRRMVGLFNILSGIEKKLSANYPFNRLGCSTYIFGRKKTSPPNLGENKTV